MLSKYVGQSEENVRALFADAEAEMAERGDDSNLHIIIFDEIDSICKQRGSKLSRFVLPTVPCSNACTQQRGRLPAHRTDTPNCSPTPTD